MFDEKIIKSLQELIERNLDAVVLPYQKGNSIRIKNYAIRKNSQGYLIFDCKENKIVVQTYFKNSALAIAKNLSENKDFVKQIKTLDEKLLKHYNDVITYQYIIKNSNNRYVKESRRARISNSVAHTESIKQKIDNFIF